MKITSQRGIELAASVLTLTGQGFGSTTLLGASFYVAAALAWIWLTVYTRMWGLMPVNCVSFILSVWCIAHLTLF
jgi:hypothetical protein